MKHEKRGAFILTVFFLAVILCSAVCAAEPDSDSNSSTTDPGIQTPETPVESEQNNSDNSDSQIIDPIISGTVLDGSSNLGLGGVTIIVSDTGGTLMAETTTGADGSYQVNFFNSETTYQVAAIRQGYLPYSKEITVALNTTNPADPNLYGTANFRLYALPAYSGNASSFVLNVGAIPGILLDIYAGKSSAWVDSQVSPYSEGEGIPLQVTLLTGDLLAGLLDVKSTGDQGLVTGGILPSNLPPVLHLLGLDLGLLLGIADSSTNSPEASGGSSVAGLELSLLNLIQIINLGVINADSSVTPDFNTGALTSTSGVGSTANIQVLGGILGIPGYLLEIKAFDVHATAIANGEPGGASASYEWSVADIKLLGLSILDELRINGVVEIPGILRIALGSETEITSPDGTYAFASGDALNIELLNLIPGYELLTLTLGHAEAEATVPLGGLDADTADLEINKTVDNLTPNYLDEVVFTLTAHNNGPDDATNVQVTDLLPAGFEWVSDDSNGSYGPLTGIWTIGDLANGTSEVLHIIAHIITSNTTITNTANITGSVHDLEPDNDQSSVTVTVGPASDLEIIKTVDNPTPNYLDTITYTITVTNNGPDQATGITVTDTLPNGLTYISDNSSGTYNHNTGLWTIGTLTNGAQTILQILAQVTTSNTQITNYATVNGTNYDQNQTNNETNTTITIGPASDLEITKTVDNSTPEYLDTITYTITVTNNGPDQATGITVTDTLPTGLTYISDNSSGTYNHNTGLWTIGNLANGAQTILQILAQVTQSNTQITNIANITSTTYDQNTTNNEVNTTITVPPASDLGIMITVDNAYPRYLDYVEFTLTAHNYGPDDCPNVKVYFTAPEGLRYVSDDSNGSFNSTTGLWSIGYMATSTMDVMHLIMQAMVSDVQMTVEAVITDPDPVAAAGYYDPNPDNNRASVSVQPYSVSDPGNSSTTTTDSNDNTGTSEETVGMQTTGIPIGGILIALLAIFTGICVSKRE